MVGALPVANYIPREGQFGKLRSRRDEVGVGLFNRVASESRVQTCVTLGADQ